MANKPIALTIAGFDPCGGAGIQADLKTFSACGLYGVAVVTAITAQNFSKFSSLKPVETQLVEQQLQLVLEQLPVRAVKIGMAYSAENFDKIFEILAQMSNLSIIIDPVLSATAETPLIQQRAIEILKKKGFPLADLVTPNLVEAEILSSRKIQDIPDIDNIGRELFSLYNTPFLIKGGHREGKAIDHLFDSQGIKSYEATRVGNINSHGSGCTLSSAITAFMARDFKLREAIQAAKKYITESLYNPISLTEDLKVINHYPNKR